MDAQVLHLDGGSRQSAAIEVSARTVDPLPLIQPQSALQVSLSPVAAPPAPGEAGANSAGADKAGTGDAREIDFTKIEGAVDSRVLCQKLTTDTE